MLLVVDVFNALCAWADWSKWPITWLPPERNLVISEDIIPFGAADTFLTILCFLFEKVRFSVGWMELPVTVIATGV